MFKFKAEGMSANSEEAAESKKAVPDNLPIKESLITLKEKQEEQKREEKEKQEDYNLRFNEGQLTVEERNNLRPELFDVYQSNLDAKRELQKKLKAGALSNEEVSKLNLEELGNYADIREKQGKHVFDQDDEKIKTLKSRIKRAVFKAAVGLGLFVASINNFTAKGADNQDKIEKDVKGTELAPDASVRSDVADDKTYNWGENLEGGGDKPEDFLGKLEYDLRESPGMFIDLSLDDIQGLNDLEKIAKVVETSPFYFFENIQSLKNMQGLDMQDLVSKAASKSPENYFYYFDNLSGIKGLDLNSITIFAAKDAPYEFFDYLDNNNLRSEKSIDLPAAITSAASKDPDSFFSQANNFIGIEGLDLPKLISDLSVESPRSFFFRVNLLDNIPGLDLPGLMEKITEVDPAAFLHNLYRMRSVDGVDFGPLAIRAAELAPTEVFPALGNLKNIDGLDINVLVDKAIDKAPVEFFIWIDVIKFNETVDLPHCIVKAARLVPRIFYGNINYIKGIEGLDLSALVEETSILSPKGFFDNIEDLKDISGLNLGELVPKVSVTPSYFLENIESVKDIGNFDLADMVTKSAVTEPGIFLNNLEKFKDIENLDLHGLTLSSARQAHHESFLNIGKLTGILSQAERLGIIHESFDEIYADLRQPEDKLSASREGVYIRGSAEAALEHFSLNTVIEVNRLHERPDAERFKIIEGLNAREIYTTMAYGEQEIYTSSFNGCFDRLQTQMSAEGIEGNELLNQVDNNKFRTFIKECTWFNRLGEFLDSMDKEHADELLKQVVRGIEKEDNKLDHALTIAEILGYVDDPETLEVLQHQIKAEFERLNEDPKADYKDKVMYGLLCGMFGDNAVIDKEWFSDIQKEYKLERVTGLSSQELFDDNGLCVQKYSFYESGDGDGIGSFENFIKHYEADKDWKIDRSHNGVVIVEAEQDGRKIKIYANDPRIIKGGAADYEINKMIQEDGSEIKVYGYRGHSFGVSLNGARGAKIINLGSCGGFNRVNEVLDMSQDAHVISTKGTGTRYVNDPLFKDLNDKILSGEDIDWKSFWQAEEKKLGGNKNFKNYVSPDKNLGIMYMKAYNSKIAEMRDSI